MRDDVKTRLYLFIGSSLTIMAVVAFLALMNINEPREYTAVPFNVLKILAVIATVSLAVFFAWGPVFDIEGKLESVNINAMLMTVLIIIQVAFFFEIISVRDQINGYQIYADIRNDITVADSTGKEKMNDTLAGFCKHGITEVSIVDGEGRVTYSSNIETIGAVMADTPYSYAFGKNSEIRFIVDKSYLREQIVSIILNLLTVLVTSVFLTSEIILSMIRVLTRRIEKNVTGDTSKDDNDLMISPLYYIRQIAFLFYFASRLSAAFIPTMAKSLHSPLPFISDTTAAGLPQTAETLLTCSAIFITTLILEKNGWKLPFISGLIMVALGTFLSAFSPNLLIFVLARAVVGLGYGFCWMTLRNLSLFGKNDKEQILGFALLNAGIYAGMNCGAVLGAILAEIIGFKFVFIVSAILTLLTSVFIIGMENALVPKNEKDDNKTSENMSDKKSGGLTTAALFVILMIAPASIAASYLNYFLPLYFDDIGKSVTDVGRAQLLYGIAVVYAGPFLSGVISSFKQKSLKNINIIYSFMIALSLFLPGIGSGLVLPITGAALLGTADSFGFGVQNNYFLSLSAIKRLGASKSLSVLSFLKKMLEMIGPMVFAGVITLGFQAGIRIMDICFAVMALAFMLYGAVFEREQQEVI